MKYLRIFLTFFLLIYIAYLSDFLYTIQLKPIADELAGIKKAGYLLFTSIPRLVFGYALGRNTGRISNWIWNCKDEW